LGPSSQTTRGGPNYGDLLRRKSRMITAKPQRWAQKGRGGSIVRKSERSRDLPDEACSKVNKRKSLGKNRGSLSQQSNSKRFKERVKGKKKGGGSLTWYFSNQSLLTDQKEGLKGGNNPQKALNGKKSITGVKKEKLSVRAKIITMKKKERFPNPLPGRRRTTIPSRRKTLYPQNCN